MIRENPENGFFRANGKIMLTGEYLVLKGADSLSLPTIKGQSLQVVRKAGKAILNWRTNMMGNYWFDARFSIPDFAIGNTNDFPTAQNIREILVAARELNPAFLSENSSYDVTTEIEFDINWGLGSSSSLIVNIASWASIDPFRLHFKVSQGSGYDIAVSGSRSPVLYKLKNGTPEYNKVSFNPSFKDKLYLVYLGKKKLSRLAVEKFNSMNSDFSNEIIKINDITRAILNTDDFSEFTSLMRKHENIISAVIDIPGPASSRFFDFNGTVKSLGAWGGDFVLMASDYPEEYVSSYLRRKDYNTWFHYSEFIIDANPKKYA